MKCFRELENLKNQNLSKDFKVEDVCRGRAVVLGLSFAVVGAERNQANGFCYGIQFVLYKALVIIKYFDGGIPVSRFAENLDLIMLDKTFRESEACIIIAFRKKQG